MMIQYVKMKKEKSDHIADAVLNISDEGKLVQERRFVTALLTGLYKSQ